MWLLLGVKEKPHECEIFQKRFSRKNILKKHTTEVHLKEENPLEFNVCQPKKSNDHFSATGHNEREDYTGAYSIDFALARYLPQKKRISFPVYFFRKTIGLTNGYIVHRK